MLPNLVIIGAMKCGTVSLHKYLSLHPQIYMAPLFELDFFVEAKNWKKGLAWYESHFTQPAKVIGERSTGYTKYPTFTGVPERMLHTIPDAKLIYIIRDPIERIVSHYVHAYARGNENRSFEEAVSSNLPKNPYLYYSQYFMQLEQYLAYYHPERILILSLEELARHRRETLIRVFEFIDVDPQFEHDDFFTAFHQSSQRRRPTWVKSHLGHVRGMYRLEKIFPRIFQMPIEKPKISKALRGRLEEVLSEDIDKIRTYFSPPFTVMSR